MLDRPRGPRPCIYGPWLAVTFFLFLLKDSLSIRPWILTLELPTPSPISSLHARVCNSECHLILTYAIGLTAAPRTCGSSQPGAGAESPRRFTPIPPSGPPPSCHLMIPSGGLMESQPQRGVIDDVLSLDACQVGKQPRTHPFLVRNLLAARRGSCLHCPRPARPVAARNRAPVLRPARRTCGP